MVACLIAVCVLASIFAQANSIACEQCRNIGTETPCTGSVITCPETTTKCIQGLENDTLDGEVTLIAFKSCFIPAMPEIFCTVPEHMIRTARFFGRYTATCSDDNTASKAFPAINNTLNGYKCPSCYTDNSTAECESDLEIECTGRQRECADMRGIQQAPEKKIKPISMKGCVTDGSCHVAKYLPGIKFKDFTVDCKPATPINGAFSN
nr:sodefrin precursor-like factor beta 5 [Plethodon albagula]